MELPLMSLEPRIRSATPFDVPQLVEIEQLGVPWHPWSRETICHVISQTETFVVVVELGDQVVGFLAYELLERSVFLDRLTIHPGWRRQGIGMQLMNKLKRLRAWPLRGSILLTVREYHVEAQLFLKACGFRGYFLRDHYSTEDGIYFRFTPGPPADAGPRLCATLGKEQI